MSKNPKIEETPTDVRTPIGALHDARRVSSERCAEASKPVIYLCQLTNAGQLIVVLYTAPSEYHRWLHTPAMP